MRVSCYLLLSQYERHDDKRCACPIRMRLTSPVGCGGMSGTIVVDLAGDLPDIYVEDLHTDLPLDEDFCSDLMIAAYGNCADTAHLGAGDIHCPLPSLALLMEQWYKPFAAQQKIQQIAHALRLASGGLSAPEDDDPLWHLEIRDMTDREHPARKLTLLRLHYRPLGLELVSVITAVENQPGLSDENISNDLLLPAAIVQQIMVRLYKQHAGKSLPIDGSSVMRLDFEAAVGELLPKADADRTLSLIARAIGFQAQPS
ncbi:MAG: hypothetical protein WD294_15260 [Phycisphaeraceae bacterium]